MDEFSHYQRTPTKRPLLKGDLRRVKKVVDTLSKEHSVRNKLLYSHQRQKDQLKSSK